MYLCKLVLDCFVGPGSIKSLRPPLLTQLMVTQKILSGKYFENMEPAFLYVEHHIFSHLLIQRRHREGAAARKPARAHGEAAGDAGQGGGGRARGAGTVAGGAQVATAAARERERRKLGRDRKLGLDCGSNSCSCLHEFLNSRRWIKKILFSGRYVGLTV